MGRMQPMHRGLDSWWLAGSLVLVGACGPDDSGGGGTEGDTEGETDADDGTGASDTADDSGDSADGGTSAADDGTGADDGADSGGSGDSTTFRITQMFVRDPHFYLDLGFLGGCSDATDVGPPLVPPINDQLNDSLGMDGDDPPDGMLDLSLLMTFRPLDQSGPGADMDFAVGDCTAPADSTECTLPDMGTVDSTSYANMDSGTCFDAVMDELSSADYDPKPAPATGPCFVTESLPVTLTLGDIVLPLKNAKLAAQYVGDPATAMIEGLMRGFLSVEDAEATTLPMDLPLVGGASIASLLPGGMGNCAMHDDTDRDGGTDGWWFYVNFEAAEVPFTE